MKLYTVKHECTGCGACANACRQRAITMKADGEGFLYPEINGRLCHDCGACLRACPTAGPPVKAPARMPDVYAAWNLDPRVRFESTSGGVFAALAGSILEAGGCVAGARYAADFSVEHHVISSKDELGALMQSKYAQSAAGDIYAVVRDLLEEGRPVLFCGTPCQNAGLRAYLGGDDENLTCCDFICRGANSPKVFRMYLDALRQEYASEIERVWFKHKTGGWDQCNTKVFFKNGRQYVRDREHDLFALGYLKYNLFCRPSCYRCRFKGLTRPVDLTLADFWGIRDKQPGLDDNRGTSMVLVHTAKGKALFDAVRDRIYCEERTTADAFYSSAAMVRSIRPGGNRSAFFKNIDRGTFAQLMKRYGTYTPSEKIAMKTRAAYRLLKSGASSLLS